MNPPVIDQVMLPRDHVWLSEALEMCARGWEKRRWEISALNRAEAERLISYRTAVPMIAKAAFDTSHLMIGLYAAERGVEKKLPELVLPRSIIANAQEDEALRRAAGKEEARKLLLSETWQRFRQALVEGLVHGTCFQVDRENVKVSPDWWGKAQNNSAPLETGEAICGYHGSTVISGPVFFPRHRIEALSLSKSLPTIANRKDGAVDRKSRVRRKSGQMRVTPILSELFPDGVPVRERLSDGQLVKQVSDVLTARHKKSPSENAPAPSRDTILRAAGRRP